MFRLLVEWIIQNVEISVGADEQRCASAAGTMAYHGALRRVRSSASEWFVVVEPSRFCL